MQLNLLRNMNLMKSMVCNPTLTHQHTNTPTHQHTNTPHTTHHTPHTTHHTPHTTHHTPHTTHHTLQTTPYVHISSTYSNLTLLPYTSRFNQWTVTNNIVIDYYDFMAGLGRGFEFFFGTYPNQKYDILLFYFIYLCSAFYSVFLYLSSICFLFIITIGIFKRF